MPRPRKSGTAAKPGGGVLVGGVGGPEANRIKLRQPTKRPALTRAELISTGGWWSCLVTFDRKHIVGSHASRKGEY